MGEENDADGDDDADLTAAVEAFLADADDALAEYDQGYADADATLRVLRPRIEELRELVEE